MNPPPNPEAAPLRGASLTRRTFLQTTALGAAGLAVASKLQAAEPAPPPARAGGGRPKNVLFIAVDDMNVDLGCYGNPLAHTPSLDRLAASGVAFQRAYCQYPLCSPSRTSLLTGLRPDTTQVYDLSEHFRWTQPNRVTLPQMFKQQGYTSVRVGKIYHQGNPGELGFGGLDDPESWHYAVNPIGRDRKVLENDIVNYTPENRTGNPLSLRLGGSIAFLNDRTGSDAEHTDGIVATEVIAQLEANKDRPFFLAAGFYRPHCPYIAPAKYFDLHPIEKIETPAISEGYRQRVPAPALASTQPWPWRGLSAFQARQAAQAYAAGKSFVDAQIGRVIDALDRLQLRDNTIIVFWSDHGQHVGDHGLWFKQSLFAKSARVPMMIAAPGMKGNGRLCPRTVELLDLYPTLADLCGLEAPKDIQGHSLRTLLDDPGAAWNHAAFTQVWRAGPKFSGHSIQTERFRYTEWNEGKNGVELYDLEKDPGEMTNLANDPAYREIIAELLPRLRANWPVSRPPLHFNMAG